MERTRSEAALVADASVLVKWFVDEEFSPQAIRLRDKHVRLESKVVVPTLARYEVVNALRYSSKFGARELVRIAKDLEEYQFLEVPFDGKYSETAIQFANDYGITIYDSSYLAIGHVRNLIVFTADERLLNKVKEELDFVHHIREFNKR